MSHNDDPPDPPDASWTIAGMLMANEGQRWDEQRIREMVGILTKLQQTVEQEMDAHAGRDREGIPIRIGGRRVFLTDSAFERILGIAVDKGWMLEVATVRGVPIYTRPDDDMGECP